MTRSLKHDFWNTCRRLTLAGAIMAVPVTALAASTDWDRAANIKSAAKQIGEIQARQGADKAFNFIGACYKTHGLSSKYSKYFEACIAQDLMLMQSLALIYSRVDPDALKRSGAPTVQQLQQSFNQRLSGALSQYELPASEGPLLQKLVDTHGMPEFLKLAFPNTAIAPEKKPEKK